MSALLPAVVPAGVIELRRSCVEHLDAVVAAIAVSLPELGRWFAWAQTMPSGDAERAHLAAAQAAFDEGRDWAFDLFEVDSGLAVGSIGLHQRAGPDRAEVGYWVRSDRTGRGYGTTATAALVTAAFRYLPNVDAVEIRMDRANQASAAIPRKLGFDLDSVESRPIETAGHTGSGFVWTMSRARWTPLGPAGL